ncbi:hypothetical protein NQ318_023222 [Aromia moschata]|uniref:HAT C-terminal dimerisation domain-containing protein n=1 Tax=Aromia moschata TaxID=1265417 RepID=A0AAV8XLX7_9CUCU|nr:hypothetical protein NQ318_023222 [Aromia moschata]
MTKLNGFLTIPLFFRVTDTFLALLPLQGARAHDLYEKIVNFFDHNEIPWRNNLIGFASDGANVMAGRISSLTTKLKAQTQNLFTLKCTCICHSFSFPKRFDTLKEFQTFTDTPIHKILHPSQTRWLSLESAVNRILEQYNALVLFFTDATISEGVLAAQNILNYLRDLLTKPFLLFLQFVLPRFNNLNKETQSETPKIHNLYNSISSTYKVLLEYFIKKRKSANQICKRFDFNNEVLINMKLIDPAKIINEKPPSIIPLAKHFPNLVNENKIQPLDNEWRLLRNSEILKDFSGLNINAEEFWAKSSKIQSGDNSFTFPLLSSFAFNMLSLPHSSANVERTASQVNLMKPTHRNHLSRESGGFVRSGRNSKRTTTKNSWDPQKLKIALNEIKKGRKIREVGRAFNIPESTLRKQKNAEIPEATRLGRKSVFSSAIETQLKEYVLILAKLFYDLTPIQLRRLAFRYTEELQMEHTFSMIQEAALKIMWHLCWYPMLLIPYLKDI